MRIKQINGKHYDFELKSDAAKAHFDNPNNYAHVIIDEFESNPCKGYLKPDSVILDIGANIGLFALYAQSYAKNLFCYEPTPAHFAILNEISDLSINLNMALSDHWGQIGFRIEPVNTTMNSISDRSDSFQVKCATLADICKMNSLDKVDFCKIDIEGGEFAALTEDLINPVKGIIKAFWVELHPRNAESSQHFRTIFENCGYKVEDIEFNGTIFCTI